MIYYRTQSCSSGVQLLEASRECMASSDAMHKQAVTKRHSEQRVQLQPTSIDLADFTTGKQTQRAMERSCKAGVDEKHARSCH
jgi:hypothetical protein